MDPKVSLQSKQYEGRPEFQNVWESMTKKVHIFWLSQPKKRAMMPYPDPSIYSCGPPILGLRTKTDRKIFRAFCKKTIYVQPINDYTTTTSHQRLLRTLRNNHERRITPLVIVAEETRPRTTCILLIKTRNRERELPTCRPSSGNLALAYLIEVPRPISKAALKYEPTERINLMCTPIKSKITPKYEKPVEKETVVEPAALLAIASPHLIELAKPIVRDYSHKKKSSGKGRAKKCRRKKKAKRSPEVREAWLAKNAAPKKWPPPPHVHPHKQRFIMRGSTKFVIKDRKKFTIPQKPPMKISKSELYRRCVFLSLPARRREKFKWLQEKDDFTERRQRKMAQHPTETIRKLALPKPIPEEAQLDLKFKPFRINKGALHYKATERIITLATPIQKQARVDSDIKENPFGVVKRALRAICTKRVAELAQPVMRD